MKTKKEKSNKKTLTVLKKQITQCQLKKNIILKKLLLLMNPFGRLVVEKLPNKNELKKL